MDDARWRRVRPALEALLHLPAGARSGELERIARRDGELAGELAELLRLEEPPAGDPLEPPAGHPLPWLRRGGEGG